MRIGLFTDSYLPRADGIATATYLQQKSLKALGHEVWVVCPRREGITNDAQIHTIPSFPSFLYEGYNHSWVASPRLVRDIKKLDLDIIHTMTQTETGILGLFLKRALRIPLVTTTTTDYQLIRQYPYMSGALLLMTGVNTCITGTLQSFTSYEKRRGVLAHITSRFVRSYHAGCDLVIAPSAKIYKYLRSVDSQSIIETVPSGIDYYEIEKFRKPKKEGAPITFVSSCRLVKEKRVGMILKAFHLAHQKDPSIRLVIVGDGPDRKLLEALTDALDLRKSVTFTGRLSRDETLSRVGDADIYLHASLHETQGFVMMEAAALGLPLILIDRNICPVAVASKSALIVSDSIHSISESMLSLAHDTALRSAMGREADALAKTYDVSVQTNKILLLYKRLLQASPDMLH